MAGAGVGQPFGPHGGVEWLELPGGPAASLCTIVGSTEWSHPGPVRQTEASTALAVEWAGFGSPAICGAVELSVND
jgi:hypothetical protein